jgi:hypothetical protein
MGGTYLEGTSTLVEWTFDPGVARGTFVVLAVRGLLGGRLSL